MPELRPDITFSMPWAMVQHLPFREQVRATALAGFQEMSLSPIDLVRSILAGTSLHDMKAILAEEGVGVGRIDPLTAWVPDWKAHNFDLDFSVTTAWDSSAVFEVAAHFGARHVSLNAMWHPSRYSLDELAGHYAAICAKAAPFGLTCDIEPIPMWGIPTLEEALVLIDQSGATNAGIVLDTTHLVRGGTPLDVLASVPGELITAVQICDGWTPLQTTLEDECFHRLWPGTGDFALEEIVMTLDTIGGLHGVGPEVFSPVYQQDNTPTAEIALKAKESMTQYACLRTARVTEPT